MPDIQTPLIRAGENDDAEGIWRIRNNPAVRALSLAEDAIPLNAHKEWFRSMYFNGGKNRCFVLEHEGLVAGYCRYDEHEGATRVSIAIEPHHHGKGWGTTLLAHSILLLPPGITLTAEVRKENPASLRVFQKNDFHIDREDDSTFYLSRTLP